MTGHFQYVLCPGSNVEAKYFPYYEKIYNCWKETWTEAFKELKIDKTLYSDAFTRQDYIGAIFHDNVCMSVCFFRWARGDVSTMAEDSYFSNWDKPHLKALASRGNDIIVCSNFTIHPSARGKKTGISMKDLLVGISIETFLNSNANAMTGALRRDRKVNEACERWGGYEIAREIPSGYGDHVDLLGFFKDHIAKHPRQELKDIVVTLWNNRLQIPRLDLNNEFENQALPLPMKRAS